MYISISLGLAPKRGTPELYGLTLYLTFGGTVQLFSQVAMPFYNPTNNESGFDSQHLVNTCHCLFGLNHPGGCEVSNCGF